MKDFLENLTNLILINFLKDNQQFFLKRFIQNNLIYGVQIKLYMKIKQNQTKIYLYLWELICHSHNEFEKIDNILICLFFVIL